MFGNKDKREAGSDGMEAANAAFRAEVERLEALPMAQLAAEVMVKGFGPGGYLPTSCSVSLTARRLPSSGTSLTCSSRGALATQFSINACPRWLAKVSRSWSTNHSSGPRASRTVWGLATPPRVGGEPRLRLMLWSRPCVGRASSPPEAPPDERARQLRSPEQPG